MNTSNLIGSKFARDFLNFGRKNQPALRQRHKKNNFACKTFFP